MNTKNNRRKKQSQYQMEQAFVELLQEAEIKDISVTDICQIAKVNRSTFYANYLDIFDLVDKIREKMIHDFIEIYHDEITNKVNSNDYLKLFTHIKENQIFYKTYFKLQFDVELDTGVYDSALAQQFYQGQYIEYHSTFFKAGITAIIKKWLQNNCDLSPETLFDIIQSEYAGKVSHATHKKTPDLS